MSALTWMLAKSLSTPAVTASLAAIGVTSGLLLVWVTHRNNTRTNARITRMQHQVTIMAGEVSARLDESECRTLMQRLWVTDSPARALFPSNRRDVTREPRI